MKIHLPTSNIIDKIIGKQQVNKSELYRLSTFCVTAENNGEMFIYNTFTKSLISFSNSSYDNIFDLSISHPDKIFLIENWFIVPDTFDEIAFFKQNALLIDLLIPKNKITSFDILPTTDCNARCFYCYENGIKHTYMSDKTANDVSEYIVKNGDLSKVKIRWFGGEPLCNISAIDIICKNLKKHNINFKSVMASNGYLFDIDLIEKAFTDWNMNSVQIPLDGSEKVYNSVKNYIYSNDINPFFHVLKNIELLLNKGIRVLIRLNLDTSNISDMYTLVDYLYSQFGSNNLFVIQAQLIIDFNDNRTFDEKYDDEKEKWEKFFVFQDYIESLGLSYKKYLSNNYKANACMADNPSAVLIMPNGDIGKCDNDVGKKTVGNIYSGITDIEGVNFYRERVTLGNQCNTCPLMPECFYELKHCKNKNTFYCSDFLKRNKIRLLEKRIKNTALE